MERGCAWSALRYATTPAPATCALLRSPLLVRLAASCAPAAWLPSRGGGWSVSDHCEDTPSRPVLCKLSFSYVLEAELLAHRTLPSPPRRLYTPYTPWPDTPRVCVLFSFFRREIRRHTRQPDVLGRMTQGFERRFVMSDAAVIRETKPKGQKGCCCAPHCRATGAEGRSHTCAHHRQRRDTFDDAQPSPHHPREQISTRAPAPAAAHPP